MIRKILGRRTFKTFMPALYDQNTVLEITRINNACANAWGVWKKEPDMQYPVFELFASSFIKFEDKFDKNEPQIRKIKDDLIKDGILYDIGDGLSYELLENIYFHYPSTAGRLVEGHTSNGYVNWQTVDKVSLRDLLKASDNGVYL